MAGSIVANNNSVYTLPVDIVDMEVPAAIPTNYLLVTALQGLRRLRRCHRKVAHVSGQLEIRGIATFWSLLVKHVQNHRGDSRAQLRLDAILRNTLESMYRFNGRDIATIAISLAKVMKQVEFRGQRAAPRILHRILQGEQN